MGEEAGVASRVEAAWLHRTNQLANWLAVGPPTSVFPSSRPTFWLALACGSGSGYGATAAYESEARSKSEPILEVVGIKDQSTMGRQACAAFVGNNDEEKTTTTTRDNINN